MLDHLKAIQTRYAGCHFRSRLDSTSLRAAIESPFGAFYCTLGDNRHWCQEHMAWTLADERCHLALYGRHEVAGVDQYTTHPPYFAENIDAAYTAARSARFGR